MGGEACASGLSSAVDLLLTLTRVLSRDRLSTLIAVPIGVWIGSNPKLARYLMPLTQIAASFPSPLVFSNLFLLIVLVGGNLQWGAVMLMMFGTIWYILFNVISGASAIPQDLRACTQLTHLRGWQQWRTLWLPGIFPALTTGWITAAGGAWNASIVSEYLQDYNPPVAGDGPRRAHFRRAEPRTISPLLAAARACHGDFCRVLQPPRLEAPFRLRPGTLPAYHLNHPPCPPRPPPPPHLRTARPSSSWSAST